MNLYHVIFENVTDGCDEEYMEMILEAVDNQAIINSIKNRNVVSLFYNGKNPGGIGDRTVEPVCLGYSKRNNLVLRVWDREGNSHTATIGKQPLPGWRLLRVDRIGYYNPTEETFTNPRPGYNRNGEIGRAHV